MPTYQRLIWVSGSAFDDYVSPPNHNLMSLPTVDQMAIGWYHR